MQRKYINSRFPHFLHGGDYNPEQWIGTKEIWDADMRLMKEANCNEMTVGIFSWAVLEPREGEYDFSFLDEIIDKIYANGGRVVLATPSGARPHWLADKYPEVLRVNEQLQRMHFSRRHNHCYTSPAYREKVRQIDTLLAQRYGRHPAVVAWHLSNEYSGECFCPLCQQAFREYLREKFHNDINELNYAWWSTFWSHRYDSFEQIEAPTPLTAKFHGLWLEWRRFVSHQTVDFMKAEIAAVRSACPELPITTNMMLDFYTLDMHAMAEPLDVISWDSYPDWHLEDQLQVAARTGFWHDFFRTLKDRPFMLMESAPGLVNWKPINKLKRPGMDKLASLQAVAHGSDTVQYFQWRKSRGSHEKFHGAVVDHVGTNETRVFKAVQETGALLRQIDEVAGSRVKSRVAILFDWDNRWALDDCEAFKKERDYFQTCLEYYRVFWEKGISVDITGLNKDWSRYDLVIAPMLYMAENSTVDKIAAYVEQGGTLYTTYMLGMVDGNDLCHLGGFPGGRLKDVFGIWNEEIDTLLPEERVQIKGEKDEFEARDFCELIHDRGARVLARYASEFYAGMPACTVNAYGKGKAYYQAFRDTGCFKRALLGNILAELGIEGVVPQLPHGVTAHLRQAEGVKYLFVENYLDTPAQVELGGVYADMETGEKAERVQLSAYGIKVFKQ